MVKNLLSASFGVRIVYFISGFLASIIINRSLGPANKGVFTLIITLSTFAVMFFEFGLPVSNIYFYGKKKISFNDLFHNSFFLYILFSIFAILAAYLFIIYNKNIIYKNISWNIIFLVFILIPCEFSVRIFRGFIKALQKYKLILLITLFSASFTLIGSVVVLVILKKGVKQLLFIIILNAFISTLIIFWNIKNDFIYKITLSIKKIKKIINYGFKNYLFQTTGYLHSRLHFFLIAYFLNPYYVGLYSLSVNTAELLKELPISLNTILIPKISSNKKEDVIYIINKGTRFTVFTSFLCALFFLIFGQFFINFFYSEKFTLSYLPLIILLPGIILYNPIELLGSYFNLHLGKPMINFWVHFSSLILNLVLNIVLIPKYKIMGAAIAAAFSYSINALIQYSLYMKFTKVKPAELFIIKRSEFSEYYHYLKKIIFLKLKILKKR